MYLTEFWICVASGYPGLSRVIPQSVKLKFLLLSRNVPRQFSFTYSAIHYSPIVPALGVVASELLTAIKAIAVTGHARPQDCETSKLPHSLDSRLTDGSVFVTRALPPREIPGTNFC
jgi:hypothetical protein